MKNIVSLTITMILLLLITTLVVLYSDGWRINIRNYNKGSNNPSSVVIKTGMLAVRSIPEGAKIYLNTEAITATDDTISSLRPGKYNLKIVKEGFEPWQKEVTVFPELVTDITAVLVLKSPRLEPLTNTDVKAYDLSSNQNNLAFLTANHEKPGIWILPIGGPPINLFRNNTRLLIADNVYASPSLGERIWWSPDDKEILVQMNKTGYLLYELSEQSTTNLTPIPTTNVETIFARWETNWKKDFLENKLETTVNKQNPPEWLLESIKTHKTTWSPDDEKFFFLQPNKENPAVYDVIVYNSEDPLPIGEARTYYPLKISNPETTKIYWYSDSYHFIIVEKSPNTENYYTVSLIRIDGTNQTAVYTGTLASDQAYPTPGGDRIVVLTSLKENSPTNLYAIAIR